jgi:galactokinase/mevalonate kinase-like predicted kinase
VDVGFANAGFDSRSYGRTTRVSHLHNRLRDFGALLGEACEQKTRISPRIGTDYINEAYAAAKAPPGGRITGAGRRGFCAPSRDTARVQEYTIQRGVPGA